MSEDKKMTLDEMAQQLVRQNVYYCISGLISDLNKLVSSADPKTLKEVDIDDDQLRDLSVQDDWEEPASYYIRKLDREDLITELELKDIEMEPEETTEALAEKLIAHLDEEGEFQEFCSDNRLDPDQIEVYEHWLVSDWFAARLEEKGGIVDKDLCGVTVWGRTTTGQSSYMDGIVQRIAQDLLDGK
jgi:hypothetical protein